MNVSAWCIKNPIPALMLFVLLSFGGLLSFRVMKIQNMPDLDLPTVTVSASLPGASPSQLETEVARKIENAIATLQGLKHITTKVQDGSVTISIEFRLEKPVQEALDDVRSAVSKVRSDLPADLPDPIVTKLDLASSPILAFTVSSSQLDDEALSWFVDDTITKKLLTVSGVGQVSRVGGVSREVSIALDPVKLQALGVTAAEISRQLREIQRESAGGRANLGSGEQPVRTLANVSSVEELRPLQISLADGRSIRLDQVATINDTVAEPRSLAMLDGKPVVGFEVTRSRGASDVEVGAGIQKALAELHATNPDIEFTEAFNFVTRIQEAFDSSMTMLYEGSLLAVLVVWLFLKDWRATLVSAVALPLSIIPAFWGMDYLGFSLNGITLLALSLVIGILVDDAIVEVENIVRHLHMGKTPYRAAMEAADEIGLAVVATTFSLVAVFLPTAFMSGVAGRFFKQFGWTAALAVLASLVVARMLTPMMAAYLLKDSGHFDAPEGRIMQNYMKFAAWCLKHRKTTIAAATAFFIGSLFLIPLLPKGFIPPDDNSQTQVFVELSPGATLSQTRATAETARQLLANVPYVKSVYTTIGSGSVGSKPLAGSQGGGEVRKATLTILLADRINRPVKKQVIEQNIRQALEHVPGARTKVGLGGSGEKYILVLSGDDPQALSTAARNVEQDLRTISGIGNIASSAALVRPEIAVRTDFARAADLGVTTAAIAETLRIATMGDYDWSLPKLNLAQRQVPIVVKLAEGGRSDLSVLERLAVPSGKAGAGSVMVSQVADLELSSGPAVIDRYDRSRNINFEVELSGRPLGDVTKAVQNLSSIKNLPVGIKQINIGDAEMMAELFGSFGLAMLTGVLCIFIVLVLLFKEFLQPITILAALPLSFGGGFVALLLTGKAFSMPSLIGLIMLMGVATKNSILLVEYAIVARRHGMSRIEALLDACRKRARAIVMTTIAMGAGMLPIAIGAGDADPSFRSPMAIAVIGGLITSTFLSLLVIPVTYTYLDDFNNLMRRLLRRLASAKTFDTG